MEDDRPFDPQTDQTTGLPLDFDDLMDDDEIERRVAAGEITNQQADELLQAAARRRVAEHGPAEDTDADGLITRVRDRVEPALDAHAEDLGVRLGREPFLAAEADPDHPALEVARRGLHRASRELHVDPTDDVDVHPAHGAEPLLAFGEPLENADHRSVPVVEALRMIRQRERHLGVPNALRSLVLAELERDATEVVADRGGTSGRRPTRR